MEINGSTLIGDLIGEYPFLLESLPRISQVISRLRYHGMLDQMGGIATLEMVSQDVTGIRELKGEKRLLDWEGFNHQDNQ